MPCVLYRILLKVNILDKHGREYGGLFLLICSALLMLLLVFCLVLPSFSRVSVPVEEV